MALIQYKAFDVEIVRSAAPTGLRWPTRGEAATDSGLECNQEYIELRGCSWKDVTRIYELETALIQRLEAADDLDQFKIDLSPVSRHRPDAKRFKIAM
jgi:hypothetical protein